MRVSGYVDINGMCTPSGYAGRFQTPRGRGSSPIVLRHPDRDARRTSRNVACATPSDDVADRTRRGWNGRKRLFCLLASDRSGRVAFIASVRLDIPSGMIHYGIDEGRPRWRPLAGSVAVAIVGAVLSGPARLDLLFNWLFPVVKKQGKRSSRLSTTSRSSC